MRRRFFVSAVGLSLATTAVLAVSAAQVSPPVQAGVVVVDHDGRVVRGLRAEDFSIRDDGRNVAITAFASAPANEARSLILILDDQTTSGTQTVHMQTLARLFVDRANARDSLAVIRLGHCAERKQLELTQTRDELMERIAGVRGGMGHCVNERTPADDVLALLGQIADRIGEHTSGRTVVVGIGSKIFNVEEPFQREYELNWPLWKNAIAKTARANISLYIANPSLPGGLIDDPRGIVAKTGGAIFQVPPDPANYPQIVNRIYDEAGGGYVLNYDAPPSKSELHSVDVKVNRSGVKVRAHRDRG